MQWNWQHKNWPHFEYQSNEFSDYEEQFLLNAGTLLGSIKHINDADHKKFIINLMSYEAYKTSEIEGDILNRDSLQSSIRKHFGLKTDHRKIPPAERGIANMMIDMYENWNKPLTTQSLFQWHTMLTNGRRDIQNIGQYRTHTEPMQIVSGSVYSPKIHFEAPPSKDIKKEMKAFIQWFNQKSSKMSPLIKSGIAHIYFESIHPFEDDNGRIGRAISEKSLSQSLKRPTLIALSHAIQNSRKNYYNALHDASQDMSITHWLIYFCETVLKAQDYTQKMINFLIEKNRFYERYSNSLNERQAKAITRMFDEGIEGFKGGLSAQNYITITGTTRATATRDLNDLVKKNAFSRTGELKHTRYHLNIKTFQKIKT